MVNYLTNFDFTSTLTKYSLLACPSKYSSTWDVEKIAYETFGTYLRYGFIETGEWTKSKPRKVLILIENVSF